MIQSIRIRNYKSIRDASLDLRQRNVLIGANKSGKTSLLDSFRLLCHTITWGDAARALDQRGGFAGVLWKGRQRLSDVLGPSPDTLEFEIKGSYPGLPKASFSYSLAISGDSTGRVFVRRETLDIDVGSDKRRIIEMEDGQGVARRLDGSELFANPNNRKKPVLAYDIPGWEAESIRNAIALWHFYDLIPQAAAVTSNMSAAVAALDVHGGNLSSWIHTLQNNFPDAFQRITRAVSDAFPEVESLGTLVTQAGTTFLVSRERHLQAPISVLDLASGELKFLMLVSLIYSFPVPLLCIEEPENHLHPRLLSLLVELANQRRQELSGNVSQLVATTHSPYLVDLLEPEDIVFVEKHEGETSFRRPESADELRRLIRESETTLGRLWFSGSLGAV